MAGSDRPVFNDRYEIHSRIGRGGMADVFLARDLLLDRPVAVKVLFPEFATDPTFVERFRREAQAAANLTHPNIVGVYDWGRQGSTYFIVMEYVKGRSLAEIVKAEGPLLPERAADVASDVAAALGFAHRNGVVHRDIKPANILVSPNGSVKVADFGIARALGSPAEQEHLTQAGSVMGTATYFSPEQAQGGSSDPRSDLYSLGIVMYEMVAGRPPFAGDNPVAIAYQQVHDAPAPLSSITPDVPRAYEAIVMKLLAKNAAARYPSAEDLRNDLRRFRDGHAVIAAPPGSAPTRAQPPVRARDPLLGAAAGAAGVAVAGASSAPTSAVRATPGATTVVPQQRGGPPPANYQRGGYDDDPPRRTALLVIGIILALLALVAGIFFVSQWALNSSDNQVPTVAVTDVVGKPLAQAEATLKAQGFDTSIVNQVSDTAPVGTVISTNPVAGVEAKKGSIVEITVSSGKGQVDLPDYTGSTVASATKSAQALGLTVEVVPRDAPDKVEGTVIDQTPKAGKVDAGSKVQLVTPSGKGKVAVPNVLNQDAVAATAALTQAGFVVNATQAASDTVPVGRVISTTPAPNTQAEKGSTIDMVVSSGTAPVAVPNVVGQTETTAIRTLQNAGFPSQSVFIDVPFGSPQDGKVISQNPPAATQAAKGSTVTINVGKALPPPATTTTTIAPTTTT